METTKNYNTIDIGKFIACIGIVALHVSPLSSLCHCVFLHSTLGFLTSLCVPYFFVISAFLFFSRNPEYSLNKLLHFVKRITILYLGWLLIYIIVTWDYQLFTNFSFAKLFNSFYGSWFYVALVISTVIITFLSKINEYLAIICCAIVFVYFVACHCGFECRAVYDWSYKHINGWFLSFPYALIFTCIGLIVGVKKRDIFLKLSLLNMLVPLLLLLIGFDVFIDALSWIGRLIVVTFLTFISINLRINKKMPYKTLRGLSVLIFMIHFYFFYAITQERPLGWFNLRFIFVLALTIVVALFLYRLSKYRYGSFLKYLF